jgi:hypothetical protein
MAEMTPVVFEGAWTELMDLHEVLQIAHYTASTRLPEHTQPLADMIAVAARDGMYPSLRAQRAVIRALSGSGRREIRNAVMEQDGDSITFTGQGRTGSLTVTWSDRGWEIQQADGSVNSSDSLEDSYHEQTFDDIAGWLDHHTSNILQVTEPAEQGTADVAPGAAEDLLDRYMAAYEIAAGVGCEEVVKGVATLLTDLRERCADPVTEALITCALHLCLAGTDDLIGVHRTGQLAVAPVIVSGISAEMFADGVARQRWEWRNVTASEFVCDGEPVRRDSDHMRQFAALVSESALKRARGGHSQLRRGRRLADNDLQAL